MMTPSEFATAPEKSFDAIVLVDVFEHLTEPLPLLLRLSKLLRPGGLLIVSTGNGDARACRIDPAQFWYFRIIEHVSMMTSRHAQWLENHLRMNLVDWKRACHYEPSLRDQLKQRLQHFAYWHSRRGSPLTCSILRHVPVLQKAASWKVAPGYNITRDHVIAVFARPNR